MCMKKVFIYSILLLVACNKSPINDTDFYIKYVIDGQSSIQQAKPNGLKIFINNENGGVTEHIRSNRGTNEFIIGPVKIGFKSKVAVSNVCPPLDCYIRPFLQIYTSEKNAHFILKKELASSQYADNASIEYEIQ